MKKYRIVKVTTIREDLDGKKTAEVYHVERKRLFRWIRYTKVNNCLSDAQEHKRWLENDDATKITTKVTVVKVGETT
jgi:hypothetical protein